MGNFLTNEEFLQRLKDKGIKYIPQEEYKGFFTKIPVLCPEHNVVWDIMPSNLLKGRRCPICAKESARKKKLIKPEVFSERFYKIHPDYILLSDYIDTDTKITYKCNKGHIAQAWPTDITSNHAGCPHCTHQMDEAPLLEDSVFGLRPDLIKYFQKSEDAKRFYLNSTKKYVFKCPECGYTKEMKVQQLSKKGFKCDNCDLDNFSFPNAVLRAFAFELRKQGLEIVTFEKFYRSKDNIQIRYDGAFKYNEEYMLVEMDGGFHLKPHPKSKLTIEDIIKKDKFKNNYAKLLNATLVRIPCYKSTFEEMKEGFYNSIFSDYFDLSLINWIECEQKARKNLIKEVCLYYEENKYKDYYIQKTIINEFYLSRNTIDKYLEIGEKLGWCKKLNLDTKSQPIKCFLEDGTLEGIYESITKCAEQLREKYNIGITISSIQDRLHGRTKKDGERKKNDDKVLYRYKFERMDKLEFLQYLEQKERGDIK